MAQNKTQKSRCTYCGSVDYGKGCRFGPQGIHFHPDDSLKCSYCGSPDYGKGCRLNPSSNLHVHGAMFNTMYKESVQSLFENEILINFLKKEFVDFPCYKHGIVDKNGNKIKEPVTEEEINSYTPLIKTVLKLKRYLGAKVDLFEATNNLKRISKVNENIEQYKKVLVYRQKVDELLNQLNKTLNEAFEDGIPLEEVKNIIQA